MRTNLAPGTLCLLLSLVACGSDGGGGAGASSFAPLVPESTGWMRVASIASPVPLEAEHDLFAVTAYDLQVDGATLRALYSIDTLIPAVQQTATPFQTRMTTRPSWGSSASSMAPTTPRSVCSS